ncbi:MAG TPA: serine hydrolase domain-containing protein [Gemmatimonadales bacterium]|nr:serine hydrolase domain-containing protein [Gemmatimonadales bacterium]
MLRFRTLAFIVLSLAGSRLDAQDSRIARLQSYLAAAAELGHLQGSVLVAESSAVLVDTAFGFANIELGVSNTPETRFRVASVTKQFSAMAIAMLAEEGKLRISDPIGRWLDSIPAEWSGITIHHLLRHTSGISDYEEWFGGYDTQAYSNYMAQDSAAWRIVRDAKKRPLDFPPGSEFHYSNSAYILLGFIIERAAGMPYEDFLRTRIHEPLGMTRSGQDHSHELLPDRASGYFIRPGAFPVAYYNGLGRADYVNAFYQLMQPPQADAGLVTTARDLYQWDQALYAERLVTRAMRDSIFTPGLGRYGYGWFIAADGPDGVTHGHSGGLPGFTCYIMRIPEHHRTIIVLGNQNRLGRTVRDLAAIMRGDSVANPRARHLVSPDSARNAARVGIYFTESGDSVRVSQQGPMLVAFWAGRWRTPMLQERDGTYYLPTPDATARFGGGNGREELVVEGPFGTTILRAVKR